LVRRADAAGLCLAVAEQYRFSPLVERVHGLLRRGELGRVTLVRVSGGGPYQPRESWKTTQDTMGGGVLLDVGVHSIDVLRYWFGEPESVWAVSPPQLNEGLQGEDAIVAVLRFGGGPVAQVQISWSAYRVPQTPDFEILGERGALQLWFDRPYLLQGAPLAPSHWAERLRGKLPWRAQQIVGGFLPRAQRKRLHVRDGDLLGSRALLEDFVIALTMGRTPGVDGSEGLRDLAVVLAGYQARRSGAAAAPERQSEGA
jgi:predicted dehydrogenase